MTRLTDYFRKLKKLMRLIVDRDYFDALLQGVAAATEHENVVRRLGASTLIDVGANKGQFSIVFRKYSPLALIFAIEPMRDAAARYRKVFRKDEKVLLFPCAAGASSAEMELHLSGKSDSSSLLGISLAQSSSFPGTEEVGTTKVAVKRIDEMLRSEDLISPVLVKIDVQGYELEAIRGMAGLLHIVDYIYAEVSFIHLYNDQPLASEVIDYLSERGFVLMSIETLTLDKTRRPIQADCLFERAPRASSEQASGNSLADSLIRASD